MAAERVFIFFLAYLLKQKHKTERFYVLWTLQLLKVSERSQGSQITLAAKCYVVLLCYQQETSLPAQELQLCNWPGARTWQYFLILSGLGYFGSWYIKLAAHSVFWTLGTGSCQKSVCFAILVVAIVAAWMILLALHSSGWYFITVHTYIFECRRTYLK